MNLGNHIRPLAHYSKLTLTLWLAAGVASGYGILEGDVDGLVL
jgi:hypothetical protein